MSDEQDKKTIPQLDLEDALKSKGAQGAISEREARTAPTLAGESIDADPVTNVQHGIAHRDRAGGVVDVQLVAADDTGLAHLPADQRGM